MQQSRQTDIYRILILRLHQPGSILDRSGSIEKSVRIGGLFPPDLLVPVPISGTIQQIYVKVVPLGRFNIDLGRWNRSIKQLTSFPLTPLPRLNLCKDITDVVGSKVFLSVQKPQAKIWLDFLDFQCLKSHLCYLLSYGIFSLSPGMLYISAENVLHLLPHLIDNYNRFFCLSLYLGVSLFQSVDYGPSILSQIQLFEGKMVETNEKQQKMYYLMLYKL